jgi:hypothetical protein
MVVVVAVHIYRCVRNGVVVVGMAAAVLDILKVAEMAPGCSAN